MARHLIPGIVLTLLGATTPLTAAEIDPLAYVPGNAGVFAHVRVGDLLRSPVADEIRKSAAKEVEYLFGEGAKEIGVRIDQLETATFCFPNMPQGPGDERTFVIILTTSQPYDKDTIFKPFRDGKKVEMKDGMIVLPNKMMIKFMDAKTVAVFHETHLDLIAKGADQKPGVISGALQLARNRSHATVSIDFSKLPNEILTAAPPELQPFLPLLKAKTNAISANLNGKELRLSLNLDTTDVNAAQDAERAFKLLMKLAADGLNDVLKEEKKNADIRLVLPLLQELEKTVNSVKTTRDGTKLDVAAALKTDLPLGKIFAEAYSKSMGGGMTGKDTNNLRQLGLAMQAYNGANNSLPPAALCDKKGRPLLSWRVALLPHLDHEKLYNEFKLDEPWDSEHNKKLIAQMPTVFKSSNIKTAGDTPYRVFHSNGALFELIQPVRFADVTDGLSNTVMIVEGFDGSPWTKPDDIEFDVKLSIAKLLRYTNDRTPVVMADGSTRFIKNGMDLKTWHLLIQRADGNPLPDLDK